MGDAGELGIEQFKSLLLESHQLTRLKLVGNAFRPEDLTVAFNLDSDAEGFDMDFSSTFEVLGSDTLSSFERLEVLELRRVSCRSRAAWDVFCARLTNLQDMRLGYISDGPIEPGGDGDVYGGYLSALIGPFPGVTTEEREVACRNLRSLSVSGCSERTVLEFGRRRLEVGHGIAQIMYGRSEEPPDSMSDKLKKMGVESTWCSNPDSEVEADSGVEADSEEGDD
ncbi:hypothetical protein M407DRAFT_17617 [Tulasnella calospora MUT 4182]|uniref:Uncharacterized protein n=1 Tax=Tulasnella calospora MUT 4182 TaxID=1051891 RepID=A0A0C3LI36_9AGAM|nr:hypothetical protein M407DRAFT_17617 [Tulasnella calospora MUT 4182]